MLQSHASTWRSMEQAGGTTRTRARDEGQEVVQHPRRHHPEDNPQRDLEDLSMEIISASHPHPRPDQHTDRTRSKVLGPVGTRLYSISARRLSVSAADPSEEPDGRDGYGKPTLCVLKSSSQVSKGLVTEQRYAASHQRLRPIAHFIGGDKRCKRRKQHSRQSEEA